MLASWPFGFRPSPIGLDIGQSGVRAVQLTRSRKAVVLSALGRCEAVAGTASPNGEPPAAVASIRRCLSQGPFRGRRAVLCMTQPDIQYHNLELPEGIVREERGEVAEVVRCEIDRMTAGRAGDLEVRHWSLPPTSIRGSNAIGVAVARNEVEQVVDLCQNAGLDCRGIEPSALALCRLGCRLKEWDPAAVWGMLDLGCRETRLILVVDGTPVLVRSVGAGGEVWTERIAERLAITRSTAEFHKRTHGIVAGQEGALPSSPGVESPLTALILNAVRTDLHATASEIKRSYEYVLSCYTGRRAADLILVGSAAVTPHLPQYLEKVLAIPVHPASSYLADSPLVMPSGSRAPFETFAVATGLALERIAR